MSAVGWYFLGMERRVGSSENTMNPQECMSSEVRGNHHRYLLQRLQSDVNAVYPCSITLEKATSADVTFQHVLPVSANLDRILVL
jgi:hypothetical protein